MKSEFVKIQQLRLERIKSMKDFAKNLNKFMKQPSKDKALSEFMSLND